MLGAGGHHHHLAGADHPALVVEHHLGDARDEVEHLVEVVGLEADVFARVHVHHHHLRQRGGEEDLAEVRVGEGGLGEVGLKAHGGSHPGNDVGDAGMSIPRPTERCQAESAKRQFRANASSSWRR
ncbi:hypothetical protein D3C86_1814730 [compost metagenome]